MAPFRRAYGGNFAESAVLEIPPFREQPPVPAVIASVTPLLSRRLSASLLLCLVGSFLRAASPAPGTWLATDSLGRTLPDHATAGAPREGKTATLFYYLWHGSHGTKLKTIQDPRP